MKPQVLSKIDTIKIEFELSKQEVKSETIYKMSAIFDSWDEGVLFYEEDLPEDLDLEKMRGLSPFTVAYKATSVQTTSGRPHLIHYNDVVFPKEMRLSAKQCAISEGSAYLLKFLGYKAGYKYFKLLEIWNLREL